MDWEDEESPLIVYNHAQLLPRYINLNKKCYQDPLEGADTVPKKKPRRTRETKWIKKPCLKNDCYSCHLAGAFKREYRKDASADTIELSSSDEDVTSEPIELSDDEYDFTDIVAQSLPNRTTQLVPEVQSAESAVSPSKIRIISDQVCSYPLSNVQLRLSDNERTVDLSFSSDSTVRLPPLTGLTTQNNEETSRQILPSLDSLELPSPPSDDIINKEGNREAISSSSTPDDTENDSFSPPTIILHSAPNASNVPPQVILPVIKTKQPIALSKPPNIEQSISEPVKSTQLGKIDDSENISEHRSQTPETVILPAPAIESSVEFQIESSQESSENFGKSKEGGDYEEQTSQSPTKVQISGASLLPQYNIQECSASQASSDQFGIESTADISALRELPSSLPQESSLLPTSIVEDSEDISYGLSAFTQNRTVIQKSKETSNPSQSLSDVISDSKSTKSSVESLLPQNNPQIVVAPVEINLEQISNANAPELTTGSPEVRELSPMKLSSEEEIQKLSKELCAAFSASSRIDVAALASEQASQKSADAYVLPTQLENEMFLSQINIKAQNVEFIESIHDRTTQPTSGLPWSGPSLLELTEIVKKETIVPCMNSPVLSPNQEIFDEIVIEKTDIEGIIGDLVKSEKSSSLSFVLNSTDESSDNSRQSEPLNQPIVRVMSTSYPAMEVEIAASGSFLEQVHAVTHTVPEEQANQDSQTVQTKDAFDDTQTSEDFFSCESDT